MNFHSINWFAHGVSDRLGYANYGFKECNFTRMVYFR